jgi:diaminohydroxyphosphoribosylaminopyrimidine deaminase/5-amino-6-(5-phosphoribosylamino)uracil reductase
VRGASPERPVLFYVARPPAARVRAVAGLPGVRVVPFPGRDGRVDLRRALRDLKARGVRRLLVEGGSTLAGSLLREGAVDQVAAVLAPCLVGADGAPTALSGTGFDDLERAPRLASPRVRRLGSDVLVEGFVSA